MQNNLSDLQSLLERLKGATGPDREIDARLYVELLAKLRRPDIEQLIAERQASHPGANVWLDGARDWQVPKYTASMDAALALVERVLPGIWYWVGRGKNSPTEPLYGALLMFGEEEIGGGEHEHSAPLAILSALLQALIASKSPSEPSA